MSRIPLGLHLGERLTLPETIEIARYADDKGLDTLWVAEGRLTRDAIVPMSLIAANTKRIRIASGVVNNKTRNAALLAVTFQTLDEVAPNRIMLGIGAWWEPIATKVGLPLRKPRQCMREYVTVLKRFFANETVNYDGEFVKMTDVRFDRMYAENKPLNIPVYLGAVGFQMLETAGQEADGVYLDFLLPPSYLKRALAAINNGLAKRAASSAKANFGIQQIISCSINDKEPKLAIKHCKLFFIQYLMQQPHIMEHSGVAAELVAQIRSIAGWPATPDDLERAIPLISDELVHSVSACGRTSDVLDAFEAYRDAGLQVAVISPVGDKTETIKRIVEAYCP